MMASSSCSQTAETLPTNYSALCWLICSNNLIRKVLQHTQLLSIRAATSAKMANIPDICQNVDQATLTSKQYNTHPLPTHTNYIGIDGQVEGFLPTLSIHEGALQGLWSHCGALLRMHEVSNCCQRPSRPILYVVPIFVTY